ncbi:hypothetical protein ON010_g13214 [Phytophthora cinnamomi]|nr:hypothetical protein ON010_g13214 [Phytophthora cinnamomi]
MAIFRMKAAATALLRVRQASQAATQRLAFSTEATDAAAAALRMGFKKAQKDEDDALKVEADTESCVADRCERGATAGGGEEARAACHELHAAAVAHTGAPRDGLVGFRA